LGSLSKFSGIIKDQIGSVGDIYSNMFDDYDEEIEIAGIDWIDVG
jgi:hypothetical protein